MPRFASYISSTFYNGSTSDGNPYKSSTMLFADAAAPTGWTRLPTHDDTTVRVTTGRGGGASGTVAFTTGFTSTYVAMNGTAAGPITSSPTILAGPNITTHQHAPFLRSSISTNGYGGSPAIYGRTWTKNFTPTLMTPSPVSGGQAHTHPDGTINYVYTSTAKNMAVRYVDTILATYTG